MGRTGRSTIVDLLQYAAARGLAATTQCIDPQVMLRVAATIGGQLHDRNARRLERARANLAWCFPDLTPYQVHETTRRAMIHMMQVFLVDSLVTPKLLTRSSWQRHVTLKNIEPIVDRLIRHEPLILVTGHCGNWELLGHVLAVLGYPVHAVARPLDNPYISAWLIRTRESHGTRIITKWGATPILQETMAAGGRLGFIADQDAGDRGLFVPFFGKLASSYKSIGLLAMRYNATVIAGFARRLDGGMTYEVSCEDVITPDDWTSQDDPLYYITARYNRAIEGMVRSAPDQFLWTYRRWRSRPQFEQTRNEMPARMRRRLEALPWMSDAELARLELSGLNDTGSSEILPTGISSPEDESPEGTATQAI